MRSVHACFVALALLLRTPWALAQTPEPPVPALDDALARGCVAAAWRASSLGEDDAALDATIARSTRSALLPEVTMRALELWSDASHTTVVATSDSTSLYDALGNRVSVEVRLTWRLERLLYVGDEAALERIRLERHEARARLATRTLEALFAWARARVDAREAVPGSRESLEASLRMLEASATLDVLTGGWFSAHRLDPRFCARYGSC
jgi:hypothetical protein